MSGRSTSVARSAALAAAALAGLALASCSEHYLARRDTLSPGSGDALDAALAKQVIDPWPPSSRLDNLEVDGQRVEHAMELYRNPSTGVPAAGPTPTSVGAAAIK